MLPSPRAPNDSLKRRWATSKPVTFGERHCEIPQHLRRVVQRASLGRHGSTAPGWATQGRLDATTVGRLDGARQGALDVRWGGCYPG